MKFNHKTRNIRLYRCENCFTYRESRGGAERCHGQGLVTIWGATLQQHKDYRKRGKAE